MRWLPAIGAVVALAGATAGTAAAAQPADVLGWGQTRWGMSAAALVDALGPVARGPVALGPAVVPLGGRLDYATGYAEAGVRGVDLGGLAFDGFLQMNRERQGLEQVLLERRNAAVSEAVFAAVIEALVLSYGPPSQICGAPSPDPLLGEVVWRFPTTTIHALVLDFRTARVFTRDPNLDIDPLDRRPGLRRNNRNFMPRRLLVRFHPTARADLVVRADCVPAR